MLLVSGLTSDPKQKMRLILPDGSALSMTIYFVPLQLGWFIDELSYGDFLVQGMRISNNPNILFQYMNQIPFGLACYTQQNREPSLQEDFSSGASKLYVLSAEECTEYAEILRQ